jgi:hypothetical protein
MKKILIILLMLFVFGCVGIIMQLVDTIPTQDGKFADASLPETFRGKHNFKVYFMDQQISEKSVGNMTVNEILEKELIPPVIASDCVTQASIVAEDGLSGDKLITVAINHREKNIDGIRVMITNCTTPPGGKVGPDTQCKMYYSYLEYDKKTGSLVKENISSDEALEKHKRYNLFMLERNK